MANHGAVTLGHDLLEAFLRMETLEHLAHIDLVAHQLGSPTPLSVSQIEQVRMAKANYLQNTHLPEA
jgi:L-fuculose-phosphate aldolase